MDLGEVSLNNDRLAAQVDLFQAALEVDERSALPLPYSLSLIHISEPTRPY